MIHRTLTARYFCGPSVLVALAGGLLAGPLRGQEHALTLGECVSLAMEENPLIRSAMEQYQASLARVRQARAFPQPSLDIDSDLQPGLTDFSGMASATSASARRFPFPGRLTSRAELPRKSPRKFSPTRTS